jgi:hypothetical protein
VNKYEELKQEQKVVEGFIRYWKKKAKSEQRKYDRYGNPLYKDFWEDSRSRLNRERRNLFTILVQINELQVAYLKEQLKEERLKLKEIASLRHEDFCCLGSGCPGYGNALCGPLKPGEFCDGSECTCYLQEPLRIIAGKGKLRDGVSAFVEYSPLLALQIQKGDW